MLRYLARRLFVLLGLAPAALAGSLVGPHGFNIETRPGAGPLMLALPDGGALLSSGSFGAQSILRRLPDGSVIPFATGFGSLAGAALSPVSGDIVVGDSFGANALTVLHDRNGDLDCLDAGEATAHPVALPILSNGVAPLPFDLSFKPGTDELYVSGSTPFSVSPVLGVVVRIAGGSASVYAQGLGFAAGQAWSGDTLYVGDLDPFSFAGRVVALHDGNADGDALDAGEATDFASGLSGASSVVVAQDGSVYVSGLFDFVSGTGSVGRLAPDADHDGRADGVDEGFLHGVSFTAGLSLSEGSGGFLPGVRGDGTLVVGEFGFDGDYLVRTAPLAGTSVSGTVANNQAFTTTVSGDAGAGAMLVLSLDQGGSTVFGLGDLGVGFGAPFLIVPLAPLDGSGLSSLTIAIHNQPGLVGTSFTAEGFTLEAGEIGIGDAVDLLVGA